MKRMIISMLCVVSVCAICSCGKNPDASQETTIAFVAGAATDFWTFAQAGCKKAESELDSVKVEFRFTSGGTAVEQKRVIDDLLVKGVSGMIVTPLDPQNQAMMIDQVAAQIPLVITDSDIPGSKRLCYIGTDNVAAGREAGKLIQELLPKGGKIVMFVGKTDAQNAKERIEGLQAELKDSRVEILDIRTDDIDRIRAKANVNDTLVKYPDIDCLVGLWSYNGPMILAAVKDAGKLGKVKIVAFDEEEDVLNGVKDGYIYGTVVQQPFEFGYQSVQLLARCLKGDKSGIPASGNIVIPTSIIKKEQAESYIQTIRSLRQNPEKK
ncbi:MAG: sugar-binding protein [Anaerohalosphaeraceae bacterium]